MKVFYVIKVADVEMGTCLNAICLLANPVRRSEVHLTVRGPNERHLTQSKVDELNSHLINNEIIIDGVGNFFAEGQKTVFLKCRSERLKKVWQKPDYDDFNPHITIYNGDSIVFAKKLFAIVSKYHFVMHFIGDRIEPYVANKDKDYQETYISSIELNDAVLFKIFNHHLDALAIRQMTEQERLSAIEVICHHLESISNNSELNGYDGMEKSKTVLQY